MSEIIKNCKFYHLEDCGSHSCLLYEPTNPKSLVKYETCDANDKCPFKKDLVQEMKAFIQEDLIPTCYRLQEENKKLREEKELYESLNRLTRESELTILGLNSQLIAENDKLKATLDDIEKIAKNKLNEGCSIRNKDCDFSCNKCLFESLNDILQLIKQAKEGGE